MDNNKPIKATAAFYLEQNGVQVITVPGKQYLVPEEEAAHLVDQKVAELVAAANEAGIKTPPNKLPEIEEAEKVPHQQNQQTSSNK